ncbi:MAG: hypothetical protein AAFO75_09890 [Pseudomonadota bacterium]
MTKLIYRGHKHDGLKAKDMNQNGMFIGGRPQMVYRGIAHNGVRTTQGAGTRTAPVQLVYRGFRTA